MLDRYRIRKYNSAAGKEQYEIFKATIRLIIRQVTARIKGTIIDFEQSIKKTDQNNAVRGSHSCSAADSKAAASEMRRVIQRAADTEVGSDVSQA